MSIQAGTETWMPVTDRFQAYPLAITISYHDYGITIWSKGHHDLETFLAIAKEEWFEEALDEPPSWMTLAETRHEWWATRCMGGGEYRYYTNPVACFERGAYPVTVVDCV